MRFVIDQRVDILAANMPHRYAQPLAEGDKGAHIWRVSVTAGGAAADLSGCTAKAYIRRDYIAQDGSMPAPLEIAGVVSGNAVTAVFPEAVYALTGALIGAMVITAADGSVVTTAILQMTGRPVMRIAGAVDAMNDPYLTVTGTAADSSLLGGKAPEYYIQPVNLLDNSDFCDPVNQRGFAGGQAASAYSYFIDRWATGAAAVTVTLGAGGMTVNGLIRQYVEFSRLAGKTVTFAARINGSVVLCSGGIPSAYGGSWTQYAITSSSGVQMYVAAGDADKIQMSIKPLTDGETVTVEWAALYEGAYTADTLPPYRPKGYAAEVLACKRYYCAHDIIALHSALMTSHNAIEFSAPIPIGMRAKPTIIITGSSDGGIYQGTDTAFAINETNISSMGVSVAGESAVRIWLSVSGSPGFTAGREGMVKMPPFALSADL